MTKNKNKKLSKEEELTREEQDRLEKEADDLLLEDEMDSDIEDKPEKRKRATRATEPKVLPTFLRPETNPNGANQWLLDPRQLKTWEYYVNIKDKSTFGNAYRSAVKAGYTEKTSAQITTQTWFLEKLRKSNLYNKGVKVLDEVMQTEHIVKKIGMFGPIIDPIKKEYVYEVDTAILKLKNQAAMFVTERLGKDDGFSTRNELTGKDGKDLPIPILGGLTTEEVEKVNQSE